MYLTGLIDAPEHAKLKKEATHQRHEVPESLIPPPTAKVPSDTILDDIERMYLAGVIDKDTRGDYMKEAMRHRLEALSHRKHQDTHHAPPTIVSTESGERKRNFTAHRLLHVGDYHHPRPSKELVIFTRDFPNMPSFEVHTELKTHYRLVAKYYNHFFIFIYGNNLDTPTEQAFLHDYRWFLAHLAGIHYMANELHTKDKRLGGIIRSFACDYMQLDCDLAGIQKQEGDDPLTLITKLSTNQTHSLKRHREEIQGQAKLCTYCKSNNYIKTMNSHNEEECKIKARHMQHRRQAI
jgi:hypothetical protein